MKKLSLALAAGALLAAGAQADITFDMSTASSDAATIKSIYGYDTYKGHATSNTTSIVVANSATKFTWSVSYNSADGEYGTSAGLLIPIDRAWGIHNLSAATAITFKLSSTTSSSMHVLIGDDSATYDPSTTTLNGALTSSTFAATATATAVSIPVSQFQMPDWLTDKPTCSNMCGKETWLTSNTDSISIAPHVKDLNFQPIISWSSTSVISKGGSGDFTISDLVIVGANPWASVAGVNCAAYSSTYALLDDFSDNDNVTKFGGYWFAFSDTSSTKPEDSSTGASAINKLNTAKAWSPVAVKGVPVGVLDATLEKDVSTSTFVYRAYAGWADMGVEFSGSENTPVNLTGIQAISFDFYAGSVLNDLLGGSYTFDQTKVYGVTLKVKQPSVDDAEQFQISIPASQGDGGTICVDIDSLKQPSWYTKANGTTAFSPADLEQLSWEIAIADQGNPSIHTVDSVTFGITNIKLYGMDSTDLAAAIAAAVPGSGIAARSLGAHHLLASYNKGLVLSYQLTEASKAQIDVLRMDGSKVASFSAAATATNLSLPVSLSHGTYIVNVRGGKSNFVTPLAVIR
jgi:hypothetical protein